MTETKHIRQCHDCNNIAEHRSNITPSVLCAKCGSRDTRIRQHIGQRQLDEQELNRAIDVIHDYVHKHSAFHYTLRLEFTRFTEGETLVDATLEDPDGENVDVYSEQSWIADACEVAVEEAAERERQERTGS